MKNLFATTLILVLSFTSTAQTKITLPGDPNDSTLLKKKKHLEAKGFVVLIKPVAEEAEPSGDIQFIDKWTNKQMLAFDFVDVEGNKISSDNLKGKYVHINFWSITCRPCIQEFPELNQLKEKYGDDVIYLAFAPESESKVNKILKNNPLDYQTAANTESFFEELGIGGYPKNFFISPAGKILKVTDGTHFRMEMRDGKATMVPDNFKIYDKIIQEMIAKK